jgi:hypothetical protein
MGEPYFREITSIPHSFFSDCKRLRIIENGKTLTARASTANQHLLIKTDSASREDPGNELSAEPNKRLICHTHPKDLIRYYEPAEPHYTDTALFHLM